MKLISVKVLLLTIFVNFTIFTYGLTKSSKVRNQDELVSVLTFGALGDGIVDDSEAFQNAILYCIQNRKTLFVPKTTASYNLNKTIRINLLRGDKIKIVSNKAIIRPNVKDVNTIYKLTSFNEHIFISIGKSINSIHQIEKSEDLGTEIDISGLIIDGINQKCSETITSYDNDIFVGAQLAAEKVNLNNCVFKNILGYGVRIHEVSNSAIKNCKFINVGGRGPTPFSNKVDLDAFGDAIYYAKVNDNGTMVVEDCEFFGKKNNNKRSRSALTFEFSSLPYNVNLTNLNIEGYAKCLHIEETAKTIFHLENVNMKDFNFGIANVLNDRSEIYLNNCEINIGLNDGNDNGDALAFLNYQSKAKIYVNNSILNFNGKINAYQSAVGLVKVENSTINGNNTNFFFADGNTIFSNCKFVNFGGPQMSFFSNNPQNKYQIERSKFKGNSSSSVRANNVKLEIK